MHQGRTLGLHLPPIVSKRLDTEDGYRSKLHSKSKLKTEQQRNQEDLVYEIRNLNEVLDRHMHFVDGFLFSVEVDGRLQQALSEELRRHKGGFDEECFGRILQNPESQQNEQISLYKKIRMLGKKNQVSYYQHSTTASTKVIRKRSAARQEPATIEKDHFTVGNIFNPRELERFMKKQPNTVSVWLPPASYPQFFCYLTYKSLYLSASKEPVLRLERFYLPRYHNPAKMFSCLLQYLRGHISHEIQHLQIRCSRANYHLRFKRWGWELKSMKEDECRLWFSAQLN